MKDSRRQFLSLAGLTALGVGMSGKAAISKDFVETGKLPESGLISNESDKILPSSLKSGSTIAITAPASPTSMYEIRHGIKFYKSMGCKIVVGETISKQRNENRYLSAKDHDRAEEFMSFINDDAIDAIVCARGGYGSMRILPYLDFEQIKKNPKIVIGFSDITALLNAIYKKTGLVTFHGPVASMEVDTQSSQSLKTVLFNNIVYPGNYIKKDNAIVINPGIASGELVGGNLTVYTSLMGTEYDIDTSGKILFLEDVSENGYQVDRMITQLLLAGKIQSASAVVFGVFKNLNVRRPFFPNRGYSILEVIEQLVKPTMIPTIVGFPFGHISGKVTLPIGINAEINTEKKTLKFSENTVS
ncbi:MAG: LD-carboxypeptidase [Candidatus Kapabacteria bacterium]|nr:LD-carboxypeptidase [Ignavibacteriota bacterium]MCW5885200.1 LD-carboxypeptidase [Candidatus Kapabacteria bacterium]